MQFLDDRFGVVHRYRLGRCDARLCRRASLFVAAEHATLSAHAGCHLIMSTTPGHIQRVYLLLTLLTTLAASFIWGVNTLFLLDAGLSNTEAFAANAFFSLGMVLFEIPTGVVADTKGRRLSFMLGGLVLLLSTLLYLAMWYYEAPFIGWALASILLGLGFTFFSGATEAWLVDALTATGFTGNLETVFGRAQTVAGVAMLTGSILGGIVAQLTSLGVPFVIRAALLGVAVLAGFLFMRDLGFKPKIGVSTVTAVKDVARGSIDGGLRNPTGALADARGPVHQRHQLLRLLCHAAIPAGAVRGPQRLQRGWYRRGPRGWGTDRGWPERAHREALLQPAHQRADPRDRRSASWHSLVSPASDRCRTRWGWVPSTWPSCCWRCGPSCPR